MNKTSTTTTFRDYFSVIYRYKIIFILLLAVAMPTTYYNLQFRTPQYRASVMMMIKAQKDTEVSYYKSVFAGKNMSQDLAMLVTSNVVLERVVTALKLHEYPLDYEANFSTPLKARQIRKRVKENQENLKKFEGVTPDQIREGRFNSALGWLNQNVTAVPLVDSSMFEIIVRDYSPERVLLIANSVSRSYVIFDLEQQIAELKLVYGDKHSTVLQLNAYIDQFSKSLDGRLLPDIEAIGPASIKIIRQARQIIPLRMTDINRSLLITFLICLLISIVISFGLEFLNQTIRTPGDIELYLNLPFLGSIAKEKFKKGSMSIVNSFDNTEYVRTLQIVADRISMTMKENNFKSLLLTDIEGAKESIMAIANLGSYLAERQGLRVLIIDANLRNDSFNEIFELLGNYGLSDMIESNRHLTEIVHEISSNYHILTSGKAVANPIPFLQSHKLAELIEEAKKNYDIVFVHSAELRDCGDSIILSGLVDGLVLILNEGMNKRVIVKNAMLPLIQKNVNIIGAVLNNRRYVLPKMIYKIT